MNFATYQALRRDPNATHLDRLAMKQFENLNPSTCPTCGVQVFDPFTGKFVIHDITHQTSLDAPGPPESKKTSSSSSSATLESLVREVLEWHADPEGPDYNECDKEPCHWCANAKEILGP